MKPQVNIGPKAQIVAFAIVSRHRCLLNVGVADRADEFELVI
jgi:hypothetical protein